MLLLPLYMGMEECKLLHILKNLSLELKLWHLSKYNIFGQLWNNQNLMINWQKFIFRQFDNLIAKKIISGFFMAKHLFYYEVWSSSQNEKCFPVQTVLLLLDSYSKQLITISSCYLFGYFTYGYVNIERDQRTPAKFLSTS